MGLHTRIDFNDPASFAQLLGSHLPVPEYVSPTSVKRQVEERRMNIRADYATLHDLLSRHEGTIQKRWANKTKAQRIRILLECWPSMPEQHRPDFDAFRDEGARLQSDKGYKTRYRDSYLWPYINQHDLSGRRQLLVLLNARGHNHPCYFASADFEAIHMGVISMAVSRLYLNEYTMMLNGVIGDDYGKLVSWDEDDDAFDWAMNQKQFIPGEGLLVLEIQERLLRFLVDCCKVLLRDIPPAQLLSDDYPPQPMPLLKPPPETDTLDSQAIMREEEPYRLPAKLDLQRIAAILKAEATASADHFWLLREDPGYFTDEILDLRSHRQELMKDTFGATHPVLAAQHQKEFWRRVISNFLYEDYTYLENFSELSRQAEQVRSLYEAHAPIEPADDLPTDLLLAMLLFRRHLIEFAKVLRGKLAFDLPGSPPMRRLFVRQPPVGGDLAKIRVGPNPRGTSEEEEYLTYLLTILWNESQLYFFPLPKLMDEIDQQLQTAKHLLSARVAKIVGSLSIVAQCLGQLDQFYPWARSFENQLADEHDPLITQQYSTWNAPLAKVQAIILKNSALLVDVSSDPKKRFDYPSLRSRKDKEVVDALRAAEANLDAFWAKVDRILLEGANDDIDNMAFPSLFARKMHRTGPWVDPKAKKAQAKEGSVLNKPMSEYTTQFLAKAKVKTRGVAQSFEVLSLESEEKSEEDASSSKQSVNVDAKALKTFRNLFFDPGVTQPGEVPWKDFRYAMATAGFEPHKLYGSVWQFQGFDKTILFHEPHPQPKIPIWDARRIGRRLSRTFGWDINTFVLKEKATAE